MKLKLYFNKKAWETAAKQMRLASWGVSGFFAAGGYHQAEGVLIIVGGVLWLVLQICATLLESTTEEKGGSK